MQSFESRPCDGPFNETRACAHAGRKEIQAVQYDPRVSKCLKEIIWSNGPKPWLRMIVYDLWVVRRKALGLKMPSSSEFDVVRRWYSIASDFLLAKLHNDVRFWITKCHLQEHSELGLKEMVVFYFHTELHWNSEIMLFNNIHNTQYSTNWIMLVNILPFPNIHFLPDLASCVWVILIHFEDCQFTIWSSFGCSAV